MSLKKRLQIWKVRKQKVSDTLVEAPLKRWFSFKTRARRIKTERFFFLYEKKTSLFFPTEKILKRASAQLEEVAFFEKKKVFSSLEYRVF